MISTCLRNQQRQRRRLHRRYGARRAGCGRHTNNDTGGGGGAGSSLVSATLTNSYLGTASEDLPGLVFVIWTFS